MDRVFTWFVFRLAGKYRGSYLRCFEQTWQSIFIKNGNTFPPFTVAPIGKRRAHVLFFCNVEGSYADVILVRIVARVRLEGHAILLCRCCQYNGYLKILFNNTIAYMFGFNRDGFNLIRCLTPFVKIKEVFHLPVQTIDRDLCVVREHLF